jgi:hypothetical protein
MEGMRQQMTGVQDTDWEPMISIRGSFLGRTDERGYLETAFGQPGGYVLVTVKPGYIPGFGFIFVRPPRPEITDRENARLQPESGGTIQIEPEQVNPSEPDSQPEDES